MSIGNCLVHETETGSWIMNFKLSRFIVVLLIAVMSGCSSTGDKQDGSVSIEDTHSS